MNPPIIMKTAAFTKQAIPIAPILKTVGAVATKAWANPLARRSMIGAAAGGAGNTLFGSPNQGSLAKRFLAGAAVGAGAGAAYHGAVRLGMPSISQAAAKGKSLFKNMANKSNQVLKTPHVLRPDTIKMKMDSQGVWR